MHVRYRIVNNIRILNLVTKPHATTHQLAAHRLTFLLQFLCHKSVESSLNHTAVLSAVLSGIIALEICILNPLNLV